MSKEFRFVKLDNTNAAKLLEAFRLYGTVGQAISRNEEGDNEQARKLFEINCIMAQRSGAKKLVMHLWDGIPSDRNIENNIEQYAHLNEIAQNYGLLLTIENVVCNQENPLLHFEELKQKYPDIVFTFDVKFAQFHNQLDIAFGDEYIWLWKGAVRHIHISDYAGGYKEWDQLKSLHPGEGRINYDKLNGSLDYLRGLMT